MSGVSVRMLVHAAARHFGVAPAEIVAPGRRGRDAKMRWAVMRLAAKHTSQDLTKIGRSLGFRDRATVRHGLARAEELAAADPRFAADLQELDETVDIIRASLDHAGIEDRPDVDPVVVASRILSGPRGETSVSCEETRALAHAVLVAVEAEENPLFADLTFAVAALLQALPRSPVEMPEIAALRSAFHTLTEGLSHEHRH